MNLRKPVLQERLAAEYALGTLRGRARARFERAMRTDAALARAAAEWQARLAPLAASVAPVSPPARLWRAIAARLGPAPAGSPRDSLSLWDSLAFWRGLGFAASGMAAVLVAALFVVSPPPPAPAPAPIVVKVPSTEMAEIYLAVLADPKTHKPLLLVTANRRGEQMQVRTLDPSIRVSGKDLELWALPRGGPPASLGLVGEAERATLKLAAAADQSLGNVPTLALSLEPKGGAPGGAPTGPVLAVGPCIKVW
jgi:anti-sigma-K factor RskA